MEKVLKSLLKRGAIPYAIVAVVLLAGISGVAAATGTFSGGATAPTATTSAAAASTNSQQLTGYSAAGGGNNIVTVVNRTDSAIKSDGRVRLTQVHGPGVGSTDRAFAYSSCVHCETLAVALQIVLRNPDGNNVQPRNEAIAINYQCTGCQTGAIAIQDVIPVADPTQIPENVKQQVSGLNEQLKDFRASFDSGAYPNLLVAIDDLYKQVIGPFEALAGSLDVKRDVETAPSTPGATPLPSPSASASLSASGAPTESSTPTATASSSP